MIRRGLGRGRTLVALGAVIALVGCFLPWYTTPGAALPPLRGDAFDGAGILVFLAAVASLALIAYPYASDRPVTLDRPFSFGILAAIGVVGLVLRLVQLGSLGLLGLPDRALGLWIAGFGVAIIAWGAAEIASAPARS